MPVSKKRKKKSGRSRGRVLVDRHGSTGAASARNSELAQAFRNLAAYRDQHDTQRAERAAALATELVADLVTLVADQPNTIMEDALCRQLGTVLHEQERAHVDGRVGPDHLAEAMIEAANTAVVAALTETADRVDTWRAAWRVLIALAGILPYPLGEAASEAITQLRDSPPGRVLPAIPWRPEVTGTVLWTRDRYGSRFAVAAPITAADQQARWYLWDIDACGHEAFTVHSGFYPTSETALAAWRAAVGQIASAGAVLVSVDDPWLLAALLPVELGFMRFGGENVEQFAEYHRSKRLAEVVKRALPFRGTHQGNGLTEAAAAVEFAAWLRARDTDQRTLPGDLDELVAALAESWCLNEIDEVRAACSPHRVALAVLHLRNYYIDEFADQLVALLPDWTQWLAMRNGTAAELADRCVPYAHGQPHPQLGRGDSEVDYVARVVE